ncbi:MAG: RraA family protein, partial [Chloroflexi bacterium]|nr:RraA family protein [Chloroflexota bacterium]
MADSPLTDADLDKLRGITSPTVCNALETFNVRDRSLGFMGPEIKCIFPDLDVMVGYACTVLIGARTAAGPKRRASMPELWEHVASMPGPRILVVQDVDYPRPLGSFWGEVNANIFKAQGCIGTVTDGGVRDLDEVHELGFHYFASDILVSHANLHLIDIGLPVNIGGLEVKPGDLLHGDKHGVTNIPIDLATKLPEAAAQVEQHERRINHFCKSPEFSTANLMDMFTGKA